MKVFCPHPFQRLKVTSEGDATMCCFQERKSLGNVLVSGVEAVWRGVIAEQVRADTLSGKFHPTCDIESCPLHHLQSLPSVEVGAVNSPLEIEIDLPNQWCNVGGERPSLDNPACVMCERNFAMKHQEDRLEEVCVALRPLMGQVRSVHIQGVAESFWKNRIFEVLDWLQVASYGDAIMVTTTTNGTILTEEKRKRFLAYPKSTVTFSIDAATAETYRLIRRLDLYDRVTDNLMAYCMERRRPGHKLKIHNNLNLLNLHEGVAMVQAAAVAGVDLLEFNPTYHLPGLSVNAENAHFFLKAEREIREEADKLDVPIWFMRDLSLGIAPIRTGRVPVQEGQIRAVAEYLRLDYDVLHTFVLESPYFAIEEKNPETPPRRRHLM